MSEDEEKVEDEEGDEEEDFEEEEGSEDGESEEDEDEGEQEEHFFGSSQQGRKRQKKLEKRFIFRFPENSSSESSAADQKRGVTSRLRDRRRSKTERKPRRSTRVAANKKYDYDESERSDDDDLVECFERRKKSKKESAIQESNSQHRSVSDFFQKTSFEDYQKQMEKEAKLEKTQKKGKKITVPSSRNSARRRGRKGKEELDQSSEDESPSEREPRRRGRRSRSQVASPPTKRRKSHYATRSSGVSLNTTEHSQSSKKEGSEAREVRRSSRSQKPTERYDAFVFSFPPPRQPRPPPILSSETSSCEELEGGQSRKRGRRPRNSFSSILEKARYQGNQNFRSRSTKGIGRSVETDESEEENFSDPGSASEYGKNDWSQFSIPEPLCAAGAGSNSPDFITIDGDDDLDDDDDEDIEDDEDDDFDDSEHLKRKPRNSFPKRGPAGSTVLLEVQNAFEEPHPAIEKELKVEKILCGRYFGEQHSDLTVMYFDQYPEFQEFLVKMTGFSYREVRWINRLDLEKIDGALIRIRNFCNKFGDDLLSVEPFDPTFLRIDRVITKREKIGKVVIPFGKEVEEFINYREGQAPSIKKLIRRQKKETKDVSEQQESQRKGKEETPSEISVEEKIVVVVDCDDAGSGEEEYLVKWAGLPYSQSTWVSHCHLSKRDLDNFHQRSCLMQKRYALRSSVSVTHALRGRFDQEMPPPPFRLSSLQLRDYQLDGLRWLVYCWANRTGCILADEMGLGL